MPNEYQVIKIDQLTRVGKVTPLETYYRIRILTKGGVVLDVDIDEKDYTEEKVPPILLREAQKSDKILALRG